MDLCYDISAHEDELVGYRANYKIIGIQEELIECSMLGQRGDRTGLVHVHQNVGEIGRKVCHDERWRHLVGENSDSCKITGVDRTCSWCS